jgi:isopentenyl phosphate kinase
LLAAGATPFSVVPGSAFVATDGQIAQEEMELIERSLGSGCLPVLYGDLVLDRERTAAILSTEAVFMGTIQNLLASGWDVEQVVWLGETEGILDPSRQLVERVEAEDVDEIAKMVGGAEGIDVTGGMRHRLEVAVSLAGLGVASRIADGRVPGLLKAALAGEEIHGTVIVPADWRSE